MLYFNTCHCCIIYNAFSPFAPPQVYNSSILQYFYAFFSSHLALLPHRIVQYSHCIGNSFFYHSYWVSFEPVSQGVCQIWTLHFTIFFPSFSYSEWIQWVTDTQRGKLSEACFPHLMHEKQQQLRSINLFTWMWDYIVTIIVKYLYTIAAHQFFYTSGPQWGWQWT